MKAADVLKLVIAIAVCEFAGFIGSIFTSSSVGSWYATVIRPEFAPPNWVFAPVWTALFALMGIAAFLVWKNGLGQKRVRIALSIFGLQLALNVVWSLIFFGLRSPGYAFLEIIVLWLAILATMVSFYRVRKAAAYILLPYLLWVSFAVYLNYAIWQLN